MRNNKMKRNEFTSMLFGLTKESVEFRNRWRGIAMMAIWFVLSGFTMILSTIGVKGQFNILAIIGLSFLKYIPLLAVVYALSKKMAARYLEDVYELDDEELASKFLEDIAFGDGHEMIVINEGKITKEDELSPVILIGGPGYIQVNLDSVALLEKVNGDPTVIHPRSEPWKLGRFERIREIGKYDEAGKREYAIINLRDQFVKGLSVRSRTKDGIPLEALDIKVIFSVLRKESKKQDTAQNEAFSFDERGVQTLVYNQTIITPEPSTPSGINFPWDTTVIPLVISELEELIKSHTLSEILASISQKEVDNASSNEQTIAQMRVELTGQQPRAGERKESPVPNFESRSKITALFFDKKFKEKAASLGVSVEWIDIGTWQLPSSLILEKHKEAWNLARENAKKRNSVERSKKVHEKAEIMTLINNIVIANYERRVISSPSAYRSKESSSKELDKEIQKEWDAIMALNPDLKNEYQSDFKKQFVPRDGIKKDALSIAQEILKAFRTELIAAKLLIEADSRSLEEKQPELAKIEKALYDVSYHTHHWVKRS
jgi:hypothetical protein